MELKEYEKKIGHPVAEMSYEEMLKYLEINQDESIDYNLSYKNAYLFGRLFFNDKIITTKDYSVGLSVLRESIDNNKRFCCCLVETETPGKRDYWAFYLRD